MKITKHYITITVVILLLISLILYFLWKLKPKVTEVQLNPVSFSVLPGWKQGDLRPSFAVFQRSCKVFLKMNPDKPVGSELIPLTASAWFPSCQIALQPNAPKTRQQIKKFFQTWFDVVEFHNGQPVEGLFTGYYMSALKGSLKKTDKFNIPLYGMPEDLIAAQLNLFDPDLKNKKIVGRLVDKHRLVPYYTRAEIDNGAIKGKAHVIAWLDSRIDRLFLEIQGSGVIELADGSPLYVGYAAQNGAPYTAIAGVLIRKGVMTRDNASMQHIRRYLEAHPKEIRHVLNQNKSFVFFEVSKTSDAFGSQGTTLTPGYSMAVDPSWVPMGTPLWLNTTRPANHSDQMLPFQRLMIAQDTGGAIRGAVRGDVYWGPGHRAESIAGRMKNPGKYWMLLPKQSVIPTIHAA